MLPYIPGNSGTVGRYGFFKTSWFNSKCRAAFAKHTFPPFLNPGGNSIFNSQTMHFRIGDFHYYTLAMRLRAAVRVRVHVRLNSVCTGLNRCVPHLMASAADVSDWIPTPAPLNYNKSGRNAVFTSDNSILQRRDPESQIGGCVSYTAHPLPLGQVWQTGVLETTTKWSIGLVSGCVPSLLYHYIIWCVLVGTQPLNDN